MDDNKNVFEKNTEGVVRNKITVLSFIFSLWVIWIHTFNLETYNIFGNSEGFGRIVYNIENYWSLLIVNAVPFFFLISGVLFFRTFEIKDLLEKWKSRVFTILIPYLLWCSIYYLYYVICTNVPFISRFMSGSERVPFSLSEWLLWLWAKEYFTLWFLKNLIVFIILTPLIWVLLKNHFRKIPTGLIALIILLCVKDFARIDWDYLSGIETYLIGSYIGLNCRDRLFYKNRILSIVSWIYIIFCLVTSFRFWNIVTQVLFLLALWFAIDVFMKSGKKKMPWWMSITFFTYVAHDAFLEVFEKILFRIGGSKPAFALADYIFMPVLVEALLIGIAFLMIKYLPKVWKILSGGRTIETDFVKA